jgi:hypothetical protein
MKNKHIIISFFYPNGYKLKLTSSKTNLENGIIKKNQRYIPFRIE